MLSTEQIGQMVFHIIQQDYHRPFVDGKANRDNIEEQITIGILAGEIPPTSQDDVDTICVLVDDLISVYGEKK